MEIYKKMKKNILSIFFCFVLCSSACMHATLFDTTIKLFIDAASRETRNVIATDIYPRAIRLVKQSAISLVGVACCSYGISLFTAQCEKNNVFADGKRICASSVLIALGGSMIFFSERLAI